ncbi:protein cereblon [Diabrotica undecimpunctata]|uniref:protein cereblon n=1 Tax=Diabrotica undecimpunctata TaxID=50387 RepID=UPI003B642506
MSQQDQENVETADEDERNVLMFLNEIANGHVHSDTSDDDVPISREGDFDLDLPTTHRYLGKLDNVRGYTLFEDGVVINTLAIYTTTMVFPGFTLPLVINMYMENSIIKKFLEKENVFVLLCANSNHTGVYEYGVTMEVFETQDKHYALSIKARGRQRCMLVPGMEQKALTGRLKKVTVQILPEPGISTPLCDTQMLNLKQKRLFTSTDFNDVKKNYKYRRYHLAQFPFSSWVYDNNEISYYVKSILKYLSHYSAEYVPQDPIKLSYWFVQNYQLSHDERLYILKLNSALERLKLEYKLLQLKRIMCCNSCGVQITDPSEVFAMSKDGIQSNYVNPGGHVYETVTVMKAQNFKLEGNPSTQFSWFPGYAWTIMQCKSCENHLGWKFSSDLLRPSSFYGLAKGGFKVVICDRSGPDYSPYVKTKHVSFSRDYIPI